MIRVAITMLVNEQGKYIGMVVALAFTSFVMAQQPAIFFGILARTTSLIDDVPIADMWVMDPNVQYVDDVKPLQDTQLYRVKSMPGIAWAVPFYKGQTRARLPDGNFQNCTLIGIDDASLIGGPDRLAAGKKLDLRESDAIFIDLASATGSLARSSKADGTRQILKLDDVLELNDHRARIVGFHLGSPSFQSSPTIYTTYSRVKLFAPSERKQLSFILVKIKDGADPLQVGRDIRRFTGLAAYTRDDFSSLSRSYFLKNSGIVVNFGLSALIAFLIGGGIAGQTFYTFTFENLRYFGVLKAMGAGNPILVAMIVSQALLIGTVGFGIGIGAVALFAALAGGGTIAITLGPGLVAIAGGAVLLVCVTAAALSIRKVLRLEPAAVFRG